MSEEVVIQEGDQGDLFYLISRGECKVIIKNYVVDEKVKHKSQ